MSTFGTGVFFICVVVGFIAAVFKYGWMAVACLVLFVYGYIQLLGAANSTFYPNGNLRPRGRRRRARNRYRSRR